MKRSDIRAGEEYAATRTQDWMRYLSASRVRVVDLGPFDKASQFGYRKVNLGEIDGTPTEANFNRATRGGYVAVRRIDREGQVSSSIDFCSLTEIKITWEDYLTAAAEVRAREKEARERQKQREDAERAELLAVATRAGVVLDFIARPGKVVISRADLRRLLDAALAEPLDAP